MRTKTNQPTNKREQVYILKELGYDGWAADFEKGSGWGEVSAFYPNQIKSSENNNGGFSSQYDDIRYRPKTPFDNVSKVNERFNNQLSLLTEENADKGSQHILGD